jgi:hypothetical protein
MDDQDIGKTTVASACLNLCHELSERLTAAQNYFSACRRLFIARSPLPHPQPAEVLEKAFCQLAEAGDLAHRLRPLLTALASPATRGSDLVGNPLDRVSPSRDEGCGSYRVCFLNQFSQGAKVITACQRSIVIRSAKTREDAVEEAKKRFAKLEGVPEWHLHATMIEVEDLDRGQGAPLRVE